MKGLLPCPFCGMEAKYEKFATVRRDNFLHHIFCEDTLNTCPADMCVVEADTKDEAVEKWNTRILPVVNADQAQKQKRIISD